MPVKAAAGCSSPKCFARRGHAAPKLDQTRSRPKCFARTGTRPIVHCIGPPPTKVLRTYGTRVVLWWKGWLYSQSASHVRGRDVHSFECGSLGPCCFGKRGAWGSLVLRTLFSEGCHTKQGFYLLECWRVGILVYLPSSGTTNPNTPTLWFRLCWVRH